MPPEDNIDNQGTGTPTLAPDQGATTGGTRPDLWLETAPYDVHLEAAERIIYEEQLDVARKLLYGTAKKAKKGERTCLVCAEPCGTATICSGCTEELTVECCECRDKVVLYDGGRSYYEEDNKGNRKYQVVCNACIMSKPRCGICVSQGVKVCERCGVNFCNEDYEGHACADYAGPVFRPIGGALKDETAEGPYSRLIGVELEAVDGNPRKALNALGNGCGIARDGSLVGKTAIEIQTPPISGSFIEPVVDNMVDSLVNSGFVVNKTCGFHVHLNVPDISPRAERIIKLINTYYFVEPIIFAMLPADRYYNRYTLPISSWMSASHLSKLNSLLGNKPRKIDVERIWYKSENDNLLDDYKHNHYDSSRYHGLNLHCMFQAAHMEIRYHQGTLSKSQIKNWIKFHQKLVDWVVNDYDDAVLKSIASTDSIKKKVNRFIKGFKIDKQVKRYIKKQIKKYSKKGQEE